MAPHPLDGVRFSELGIDYLIDRVRAARLDPSAPAGMSVDRWLCARLELASQLSDDPTWARRLAHMAVAGPDRRIILAAMVLDRDGDRRFDPSRPFLTQLSPDALAVLDILADERGVTTPPVGDVRIPLAAPLRPRAAIPGRAPTLPGALEVIEIGDLGDDEACRGHVLVHEALADLEDQIAWRWLYAASYRSLPASHRTGAIVEEVLARAPHAFWAVVDTFANAGPVGGCLHAGAALGAAGHDPMLARPPLDGTALPAGILEDRVMADACGLPMDLRPLFAVGRTLYAGLDAAVRIRALVTRA